MKRKENLSEANRNIDLTFVFLRKIVDNPKIANQIPDKAEIIFVGDDCHPEFIDLSRSSREASKK